MSAYTETMDRLVGQAEAHVDARRFDEAERGAREVLAQQPRNARAHHVLAVSALMQDRHAEAFGHIENAIRADRVNPRYHFVAALALAPQGRLEEAMASYRRVLQLRPDLLEARGNLGYLLECVGRVAEAADCYRQNLARNPNEWLSLNRLGYCERLLDRGDEAVKLLQRAIAVRGDFAPTHNELALAYLHVGRAADAVASFRRAVELAPQFLDAWCNLGKVLYLDHVIAAGAAPHVDRAPVLECFDRILALDPQNVEFAYLRDCVAGVSAPRPPDGYIETLFDRFAPRYDEKLTSELQYRGPEAAEELMRPWLGSRSGLRVVDLGCGTGLSGGFLRRAAASLVGVDLSAAMLERARARGIYDEVVQADIASYLAGLEAGSLDLAVALDVFNYLGDVEAVLGAAAAALRPGGRMLFSVELPPAGSGGFVLLPAARYAHAPEYVEATAAAAGLRVADTADVAIRREANRPVQARLYALEKPPA